jgi:hypothetical protein
LAEPDGSGAARVDPAAIAAYARFLRAQSKSDDPYLFTDARVRFRARDDDVVVRAPGLRAVPLESGSALMAPQLTTPLTLPRVPYAQTSAFLAALDGERPLAAAARVAKLDAASCATLLNASFGLVLFAPLAVGELERALPCAELMRFPGSPYEVVREYWENMIAVRAAAPALEAALSDADAAVGELRRLHQLALLGAGSNSFYRPASPIVAKGIVPGELFSTEPRLSQTPEGRLFLEGPRVNANFLGGPHYLGVLARHSGDLSACEPERAHVDEQGVRWGSIVIARAEQDAHFAPWFCPPRPFAMQHWTQLFGSLAAALAASTSGHPEHVLGPLAQFHQRFVRLHPFRAANQSLAMNLVNRVLSGVGGAGVPHLLLDQLALRFSEAAYERQFACAVAAFAVRGTPIERHHALSARKARYFDFIERLVHAPQLADAEALVAADPEAAAVALIPR